MTRRASMPPLSRGAVPIDIPAVFLADTLREAGSDAIDRLVARNALLAEYHEARGHSFAWGHVIESRVPPLRTWRIVPVALWERLARRHNARRQGIPQQLISLAPLVRTTVAPHLPASVKLAGLQAEGRRHRYTLFTLLLTDPADHRRVRRWLHGRLVPDLLPELLVRCEDALREQHDSGGDSIARKSPRRTTKARSRGPS